MASNASESPNVYSFNDIKVNSSKYFYRLRMVDLDGTYSYTKVVSVSANKIRGFRAYPTIFSNELNLSLYAPKGGLISFSVYNTAGEKIQIASFIANEGNNQFHLTLSGSVPKGQYYIRENTGNRSVAVLKQ